MCKISYAAVLSYTGSMRLPDVGIGNSEAPLVMTYYAYHYSYHALAGAVSA